MSFFITSAGPGQRRQPGRAGRAPMRTASRWPSPRAPAASVARVLERRRPSDGQPAVNARDRIGKGPWVNAKGVKVADSVADLHSDNNQLGKANSLTEKGADGERPRRHAEHARHPDRVERGRHVVRHRSRGHVRQLDERRAPASAPPRASRQAGRRRRTPIRGTPPTRRKGCSQANLVGTGGAGLFYCFASELRSGRVPEGCQAPIRHLWQVLHFSSATSNAAMPARRRPWRTASDD